MSPSSPKYGLGIVNGPPHSPIPNGKGKNKAEPRDLEAEADAFESKCLLLRQYFAQWQERTTDRAAWAEACKEEASTVLVPADYQFLVGPISFSGPYCKPNIVFQVIFACM